MSTVEPPAIAKALVPFELTLFVVVIFVAFSVDSPSTLITFLTLVDPMTLISPPVKSALADPEISV